MRRVAKEFAVAAAITCIVVVGALLIAQGRIASKTFLDSPGSAVFHNCSYFMSLPGIMVGVAIWGYTSQRTLLSDALAVAVNTVMYSVFIVFLIEVTRFCRRAMAIHDHRSTPSAS